LIEQNDIDNAARFAERFRTIVLEQYPDWDQYFIPPNLEWQTAGDIAIEVPSRFAPKCPLRIETMWEGIIINWVGWHVHCDGWGGQVTEDEFVGEALEIVNGILTEFIVIITTWKDGSSGAGGNCLVEDLESELEGTWSIFGKGKDIVVLSWKGTYDRGTFDPAWC